MCRNGAEPQGVAVGRSDGDSCAANVAAGARAVDHQHRLADGLGNFLADHAHQSSRAIMAAVLIFTASALSETSTVTLSNVPPPKV